MIRIDTVTTTAAFGALRADWSELLRSSAADGPFLTWEWLFSWWARLGDGLELHDAWITAAVRCAPPDNKPTPEEFEACLPFLDAEWRLLARVQVVVTLGKLAWDATWRVLAGREQGLKPRPVFAHGACVQAPAAGPLVLGAFHPSQQNTFTGRLTPAMLSKVFQAAAASRR